ncbi:MAG: polyribonucleotide nucleotidyltransferase [Bacillota bacterium]|nr:polyribonucleotide nucleotidyltransferase [Bacillota bacterium]
MEKRVYSTTLAGRPLTVEIGEVAKQANGACLVRYGDTVVLVTAVMSKETREGIDFFPLRVDFEERQYAAGRIPGSFFRREGRPSERAVLSARLMDRPIRPLFPKGLTNEVQVVCTVLSFDGDNQPDILGIIGESIALSVSDIPFDGPIAGVTVGLVDGNFVLNPTLEQYQQSRLDLTVAGTREAVIMVEGNADELPEEDILAAMDFAHRAIRQLIEWQDGIVAELGRPKFAFTPVTVPGELEQAVRAEATEAIRGALRNPDKLAREEALAEAKEALKTALLERYPEQEKAVATVLDAIEREQLRRMILSEKVRPDGRRPDEIRPVSCRVGLLPRTHGSALFTRGQTQALTVAALGALEDRQFLDSIGEPEEYKRYLHHYNFPPYSTGEVRPLRAPGRREIGHGRLAEMALQRMIPSEEEFPYTIRLVSEILESNGSSSMASVCGSTLALMDAGVPIREPVAGIAMGLISEGDQVEILSDIQGIEDHLGDMDFKVAGTRNGITAMQLDAKIEGVDRMILARALEQARQGRLFILGKMLEAIDRPRSELSPYAPRILTLQINPDRIRDVIGPGGRTINRIVQETGAKIDVEETGKIYVATPDLAAAERAVAMIRELTHEVEPGEVYLGKVVRLTNFGAFVELFPGKDGLVHISQLGAGPERTARVEDVVSLGDRILVKVTEIDELGRVNLSRREALRQFPDRAGEEEVHPKPVSGDHRGPSGKGPSGRGGEAKDGQAAPADGERPSRHRSRHGHRH